MVRRAETNGLDQGNAEREACLGIVGQAIARRAVDQRVEIGETAQRFRRDRVGERLVIRPIEVARGRVQRRFERQAPFGSRRRAGAGRRGGLRCRVDRGASSCAGPCGSRDRAASE
jgi:hypothetical protein